MCMLCFAFLYLSLARYPHHYHVFYVLFLSRRHYAQRIIVAP